ncbi:hypothetical protein HY734_02355 [Candidatus Uhrbacteria bacterium]|nr:hypothetical protein [Candidatus Uhrbacteria bacterium]
MPKKAKAARAATTEPIIKPVVRRRAVSVARGKKKARPVSPVSKTVVRKKRLAPVLKAEAAPAVHAEPKKPTPVSTAAAPHCAECQFIPLGSAVMVAVLSGLVVALSMCLMQAMLFL